MAHPLVPPEAPAPEVRTPRLRNTLDVLEALQRQPSITPLELATATRLSRSTIAAIIRQLTAQRLIEPDPSPTVPRGLNGGRPASHLRLRPDAAVALSIDIGLEHVCVALGNLAGLTTAPVSCSDVTGDAPAFLEKAVTLVQELMGGEVAPQDLIGVCVGLPAPIDQERGKIASTAGIDSWTGIRPADELRYRLGPSWQGVPFILENDANLVALAELSSGSPSVAPRPCQDVVLVVKWSDGLGGALLVDGELFTGDRGLAFELGHTQVSNPPPYATTPCDRCGHICLESVAGGAALAASVSNSHKAFTFGDLVLRAVGEDGPERDVLRDAAKLIGEALGRYVTMLNPRLIVISGRYFGDPPDDVAAYRIIVDPLREGMRSTGFPIALEDVDIAIGKSPAFAAAEGGIVATLRRLLPSHLEQRV